MAAGNDPLEDQPQQLQEEVARLRADNRRLLAELEQLAAGDRGPGPGPVAADPLSAEADPAGPGAAEDGRIAEVTRATGQPMILGALNSAADMTFLDCTNSGHALRVAGIGRAVSGVATAGPGLHGFSNTDNGVVGLAVANALNGVQGQAHNPGASGVYGQHDNNGYGVAGRSRNIGVFGESTGNGLGVYGASSDGHAVQGASINGSGVRGMSANSVGVVATTNSATAAGVLAENDSGAPGGVAAIALGQAGVGVYASGEQAAVQLGRSSLTGAPTTGFHNAGELVLDANADLYLCKASGSPGTWKLLG
jgi:hypothetical protein